MEKPIIVTNSPFISLIKLTLIMWLLLLGSAAVPTRIYAATLSVDKDIELIKRRIKASYASRPYNIIRVQSFLNAMSANGSWSDINYADQSAAVWKPMDHLYRLLEICICYKSVNSQCYNSPGVLRKINTSLDFWFKSNPKSTNWWQNTIGQQLTLIDILNIIEKDINPTLLRKGIFLLNDPTKIPSQYKTGQNLVWYASEQFARGTLNGSSNDISTGLRIIQSQIKITTGEGIQPDFSFHQHGPQLYNGSYGLEFIKSLIYFAKVTNNTKFAFAKHNLQLLASFMLKGTGMMIRGRTLDYSTLGRAVTRKDADQAATTLLPIYEDLKKLLPEKQKDFSNLINHINGTGAAYSFIGNKYFWDSDFMVHQRHDYYFSVKMVSNRTIGTEQGNNENLQGGWLAYGLTYIMKSGSEYKNIFPIWDWNKLPGVTCMEAANPILNNQDYSLSGFVSGVSDGIYGAATMQINRLGLTGKKSWFMFDNEVVALGSDIKSLSSFAVNTTLNQCIAPKSTMLNDGVTTTSPGRNYTGKAAWVLNGGIGYIFPKPADINLKNDVQSGTWKFINRQYNLDAVQQNVFTLWINHGKNPASASYAYILLPRATETTAASYYKAMPVTIIGNNSNFQAVTNNKLKISQMVLFRAAHIQINPTVSVDADQPCLIIFKNRGAQSILTVSSFYQNKKINLVTRINGKTTKTTFVFANHLSNGVTQTKIIR